MLTLTGSVPVPLLSVAHAFGVVNHSLAWIIPAFILVSILWPPMRGQLKPRSAPGTSPHAGSAPVDQSAHASPQSLEPRRIEPSPALSHPATHGQQWRQKRYWIVWILALWSVYLAALAIARTAQGHDDVVEAVLLTPSALLLCVAAYLVNEVPRQKRLLRRSPWVEYPVAVVEDTGWTKVGRVNVTFLDAEEKQHSYQMDPNDDDFERGDRPIWFAGRVGKKWAVLSLRQGDCTGMGYTQWVGGVIGLNTGASAVAARHTSPPQETS